MVGITVQKIRVQIAELFVKRVIFLFLVAALFGFLLINQRTLQAKTLNYLLPSAGELHDFAFQPEKMNRESLNNLLIYYKTVYNFLENDPEAPAPCAIVGYAQYYLGNQKQAISFYKRAIELNDLFFWFHYNLGVIYYNREEFVLAEKAFLNALNAPMEHVKYFLVITKTHREIATLLNLKAEDYVKNLDEGYEVARELYIISKMMVERPEMRKRVHRPKMKLNLF